MNQSKIVVYPNSILRVKTVDVIKFDRHIQKLATLLITTMIFHRGIGIAAPQIGRFERIFVLDASITKSKKHLVCINPKLEVFDDEYITANEGCLSFPNVELQISRPSRVIMTAQDPLGKRFIIEADGDILSRAIQHEFDHLEGRLMIDFTLTSNVTQSETSFVAAAETQDI